MFITVCDLFAVNGIGLAGHVLCLLHVHLVRSGAGGNSFCRVSFSSSVIASIFVISLSFIFTL